MNRRELFRQTWLGAAGASAAAVSGQARIFPEGYDASKALERADWKPVFFDDHQNETVIVLSDLMIPDTETPGAKSALVNRFLDELLAAEARETQQSFRNSLAYIDGEARKRYKDAFVHIPKQNQIEFLTLLAYPHTLATWGEASDDNPGHLHFERLKDWISRAFWSSDAGMKAIGWNGEAPHGVFTGCQQPDSVHSGQKRGPRPNKE